VQHPGCTEQSTHQRAGARAHERTNQRTRRRGGADECTHDGSGTHVGPRARGGTGTHRCRRRGL